MIILIPIGGIGKRLQDYTDVPKALVCASGRGIIFWLLDNLTMPDDVSFICIPYNSVYKQYNFEKLITDRYPNFVFLFHCLETQTNGAAETVLRAIEQFSDDVNDQPIICIDADNFYTDNILLK